MKYLEQLQCKKKERERDTITYNNLHNIQFNEQMTIKSAKLSSTS